MTGDGPPQAVSPEPARRLGGRIVAEQRGPVIIAMAGGVVRQLCFLGLPWAAARGVDALITIAPHGSADGSAVLHWAIVVVVLGLVQFAGLYAWIYGSNLADVRAGVRLRVALARRLVGPGVAPSIGAADLALRAGRDVGLVRRWVHGLASWAVIGTTVVVLIPALTVLDPILLGVAVATVPALIAVAVLFPRMLLPRTDALADAHAARADLVDATVRDAESLRGMGATGRMRARHHEASSALTLAEVRVLDLSARWQALGSGIPRIAVGVGALAGGLAALDGRLTVGGLVAFVTWMGTVGIAVDVALIRLGQRVDARVGLRRLAEVLGPDGLDHPDTGRRDEPPAATGAVVRARGVTPAGGDPVDLEARPGQLVAVTGRVGAGKSTLLRMLAGLEAPLTGSVSVAAAAREGASTGGAAPRIHLVPQRPLVLPGTVRHNLTLGADASDQAVSRALADVGLEDELSLDSEVTQGDLSGGQVQRLALARGLLDEAPVLLLDDVTAALDEGTVARLRVTLLREAERRAVVLVTHRADLLGDAAEVVTLGCA